MKLISDKMADALDDLAGLCFVGNRIYDRAHTVLDVEFFMPITSEIVHIHMAHQFPLLADKITDYCSDRGYAQKYKATMEDGSDYNSARDIFEVLLNYMIDLEKQTCETIKIADEENDIQTKIFLGDFLKGLRPYTKMASSLLDFYIANKGNDASYDSSIDDFLGIDD